MQFPNRSEIFDPSEWEPSSLEEQEAGLPPYTWVEIKINRRDIQECYGYREKSVGFVIDILTKSETHPYGIMVQIQTGEEGRVQRLLSKEEIEEIDEESRKEQIKNLCK